MCLILEFLDSTDTSLAYAIYGASHACSFPIAAVSVLPEDSKDEEFILCFHGKCAIFPQ